MSCQKLLLVCLCYIIACCIVCICKPIQGPPSQLAFSFMRKFGYLKDVGSDAENLYKEETIIQAIKSVQKFGGLNQTGVIDDETAALFTAPRCGRSDISHHPSNRTKRFIIGSEGWRKRHLTYYLANWSPKLGSEGYVLQQLQKAFNLWSDYSRLTFNHVNRADADIVIFFASGYHGDGYPMDGPGNVLAHAFFPYEHDSYGGDIHFDEDEDWITEPGEGFDFFTVAAHEIGHSLGLAHSPVSDSLMFPYYKHKGYNVHFLLDYDDILAVYQLYVMQLVGDDDDVFRNDRTEPPTTDDTDVSRTDETDDTETEETVDTDNSETNETEIDDDSVATNEDDISNEDTNEDSFESNKDNEPPLIPHICNGHYDTISTLRNELFVFKDKWLWRYRERGLVEKGYPIFFQKLFRFPTNVQSIDAAYERPEDNHIVLFSEAHYWLFDGDKIITTNPLPLTDLGLPADLERLDAALVWGKNHKTYFFRNELYWRFNETTRKLDEGYPQNMDRWRGIPSKIDTAFQWTDGKTYFFAGRDFYRFNDAEVVADEQYPLSVPDFWFGCEE